MENEKRSIKLVLVEDSEADIDLLKFCLEKNKIHIDLKVFNGGEEALKFLKDPATSQNDEMPDIILLDINLPGMDGIEILQNIKEDENLKHIPTVMLTSSKHEEDIIKSYSNHANCFLQKPLDLTSFQQIINMFEEFWFTIVTLPKKCKT